MQDNFLVFTKKGKIISDSVKARVLSNIDASLNILIENIDNDKTFESDLLSYENIFNSIKNSQISKKIKYLSSLIKNSGNNTISGIEYTSFDHSKIKLSYSTLFSIVHVILHIIAEIDKMKRSDEILRDFVEKCKQPKLNDTEVWRGQTLLKIIEELNTVKTIDFCLDIPKVHGNLEVNKFAVSLFAIFFKSLFQNVLELNLDLNINQLNQEYAQENEYSINDNEIIQRGSFYKENFLANFFLLKQLFSLRSVNKVSFIMYDSYQLEMHYLFSRELFWGDSTLQNLMSRSVVVETSSRKNSLTKKQNSIMNQNGESQKASLFQLSYTADYSKSLENYLVYFLFLFNSNKVFKEKAIQLYYEYKFSFNSLDPLLFNSINKVILKNSNLCDLKLKLFSDSPMNLRKYLINTNYFNYYNSDKRIGLQPKYDEEYKFYNLIDLDSLSNLKGGQKELFIIKPEKILDQLFDNFNDNLLDLTVLISEKIDNFTSLVIDLSTDTTMIDLQNHDKYNCALICFMFNIFKILQKLKKAKLNLFEITFDNFNENYLYIFNKIKKEYISYSHGFKLNNTSISQFSIYIKNISEILPFENFPSGIQSLTLGKLSYNDFKNLVNKLAENEDLYQNLVILNISFDYTKENILCLLEQFLKSCILPSIEKMVIDIPFNISFSDIEAILLWAKSFKGENRKIKIHFKVRNEEMRKCNNLTAFKTQIFQKFKKNLKKKDFYCDLKCENFARIDCLIKILDIQKVPIYIAVIHSLNKKGLKNELKNQKIFKEIFYQMGRLKTKASVTFENFE